MAIKKTYAEVCNDTTFRTSLTLKIKGQKGKWFEAEGYECISFWEVPEGKYCYYARHRDNDTDVIGGIKPKLGLTVNFWGTIVTDEPLEFPDGEELVITRMIINE